MWHSARRGRVGFANNGIWGDVFNARATHGPRGRRSHIRTRREERWGEFLSHEAVVSTTIVLSSRRVIVPTNTNRPARLVIASPRAFAPRHDGRPLRLPAPTAAVSRKPPLSSVYRGPRNRRPRTTLAPQLASLHANPRPRSLPCSAASRRPQRGPAQAASPLATSFAGHRPRAVPRAAATDPPPEQPLRRRQPVPDPRRAPTSLPFVSAARSPIHAEHRGTSLLGTSPAPRCYPHGGLPPPSREPPSSALRTWRAPARVPGFRRRLATCAPGFRAAAAAADLWPVLRASAASAAARHRHCPFLLMCVFGSPRLHPTSGFSFSIHWLHAGLQHSRS